MDAENLRKQTVIGRRAPRVAKEPLPSSLRASAAVVMLAAGLLLIGPVAAGFLIQGSGAGAADPSTFAPLIGMTTVIVCALGAGTWMFWTANRPRRPASRLESSRGRRG